MTSLLLSSSFDWLDEFHDDIMGMGFKPCTNEPDMWMHRNQELNIWEHAVVCVDDQALVMRNPQELADLSRTKHKLKGVGHVDASESWHWWTLTSW